MKIRGLVIAAILFFVLAGVLFWSNHHNPADTTAKADTPPAVLKLDEGAIDKIELKKKDAEPIVLAKSGSDWQITDPQKLRADQGTVSSMVSTLSSLNSERVVEDKASDLRNYGFDQPAVEVSLTEKNNKSQKLLFGDDTPTGGAVYAMLAGKPTVYTVPSYAKNSVDKSLNDLRDKRLLTMDSNKLSRVELLGKNGDIEFGRSKDEWQILKPKPLPADSSKVDDLVRKLTDARMDLSGSDPKAAAAGFAHGIPVGEAKLTDQSGTQELQVRKNKDAYYAKSSVVEGAYKVDADLANSLDKKLDDFRDQKLFHFGFDDPNKVEIHNGSRADFLTHSGADWWSNGKKMDASSVEPVVGKLRDLTASKLLDSGFKTPSAEATVTSDDGKRVEKVAFAKVGDHYLAKRDNDPTVYQLDADPVDELLKAADQLKPASTPSK